MPKRPAENNPQSSEAPVPETPIDDPSFLNSAGKRARDMLALAGLVGVAGGVAGGGDALAAHNSDSSMQHGAKTYLAHTPNTERTHAQEADSISLIYEKLALINKLLKTPGSVYSGALRFQAKTDKYPNVIDATLEGSIDPKSFGWSGYQNLSDFMVGEFFVTKWNGHPLILCFDPFFGNPFPKNYLDLPKEGEIPRTHAEYMKDLGNFALHYWNVISLEKAKRYYNITAWSPEGRPTRMISAARSQQDGDRFVTVGDPNMPWIPFGRMVYHSIQPDGGPYVQSFIIDDSLKKVALPTFAR